MSKNNICILIISLENEIEFLSEIGEVTTEKKKELRKLYSRLRSYRPGNKHS